MLGINIERFQKEIHKTKCNYYAATLLIRRSFTLHLKDWRRWTGNHF